MELTDEQLTDVAFADGLQRLDDVCDTFTGRFLRGGVSLWVGSRISDARYPNLDGLLTILLDALHGLAADPADPTDPARQTLDLILDRVAVPDLKRSTPFSNWHDDQQKEVLKTLWDQYDEVLNTPYHPGGEYKSLVRDVLHVEELYDQPGVKPDAEHRFIALLVAEGTVRDIVTTNWDPLIEDAHAQAANGSPAHPMHTVVRAADLAPVGSDPKVTKMHGCARTARQGEEAFDLIVATSDDVLRWTKVDARKPIRDLVSHVARCHTVLYIGLSGQDFNIQLQHVDAGLAVEGVYTPNAPRVLFSGGKLDDTKSRVLRAAYGPQNMALHHTDIEKKALVPLYAKPLLGALYAYILREKLRAFARALPDGPHRDLALRGVDALVRRVGASVDAHEDPQTRWRFVSDSVARFVSSFVSVYRHGRAVPDRWDYHPLTKEADPDPQPSDYWLALLIGVLAEGQDQGRWTFGFTPDAPEQLRIRAPTSDGAPVFIPVYVVCDGLMSSQIPSFASPSTSGPYLVIHTSADPGTARPPATPFAPLSMRAAPPVPQVLYRNDWVRDGADPVDLMHEKLRELALAA